MGAHVDVADCSTGAAQTHVRCAAEQAEVQLGTVLAETDAGGRGDARGPGLDLLEGGGEEALLGEGSSR